MTIEDGRPTDISSPTATTPYRENAFCVQRLPIGIGRTLLQMDLSGPSQKPFLPVETDSASVTRHTLGAKVVIKQDGGSYAHFFNDYVMSDFAFRVKGRLDKKHANDICRIWFRRFLIDDCELSYQLSIRPTLRQYRLACIAGPKSRTVLSWTESEHIRWGCEPNTVEIRVLGHNILGLVNDQPIFFINEGCFGRGDIVVGFWGEEGGDAYIYESVEIMEAVPG